MRVGPVQTVSGGSLWGSGFVLYDETGNACVTFGYFSYQSAVLAELAQRAVQRLMSENYAKAGREHVVAALENAASVIGVVATGTI